MSILHLFKKYVDPERYVIEEGERYTLRNLPSADADGDPPPLPRLRCRVCGHEGEEPVFCPHCLAETMVAVEK